jgi:hypothetical protein
MYNPANGERTWPARNNNSGELPEEMRIVLDCSPDLEPCKKFRDANIFRLAEHLKERKCQRCIEI